MQLDTDFNQSPTGCQVHVMKILAQRLSSIGAARFQSDSSKTQKPNFSQIPLNTHADSAKDPIRLRPHSSHMPSKFQLGFCKQQNEVLVQRQHVCWTNRRRQYSSATPASQTNKKPHKLTDPVSLPVKLHKSPAKCNYVAGEFQRDSSQVPNRFHLDGEQNLTTFKLKQATGRLHPIVLMQVAA